MTSSSPAAGAPVKYSNKKGRKRSQREQWWRKTNSEESGESNSESLSDEMYAAAELLAKLKEIQRENAANHLDCVTRLDKIDGTLKDIKERVDVFGCEITALHKQSHIFDKALKAIHEVVISLTSVAMRQEGKQQKEPPAVKEEVQDESMKEEVQKEDVQGVQNHP